MAKTNVFLAITSKKEQIQFIQNYTHTQWTSPNPKMQISQWVSFFKFFTAPKRPVRNT